ncbi:unnamed protein product, partial [Sphacelaria rigidula]
WESHVTQDLGTRTRGKKDAPVGRLGMEELAHFVAYVSRDQPIFLLTLNRALHFGLGFCQHSRTASSLVTKTQPTTFRSLTYSRFWTVEVRYFEAKTSTHRDSNPRSLHPNGDSRIILFHTTG